MLSPAQMAARLKGMLKLNLGQARQFSSLCESLELDKGQVLFREEEPGLHLYLVVEGGVEAYKHDLMGDLRLAEIRPGGIVGEMALLEGKPRSAHARALKPTLVLALSRSGYEKLKSKHPAIATRLQDVMLRHFSNRLRETTEKFMARVH
jgi:CRP-like cAMP-binding protein